MANCLEPGKPHAGLPAILRTNDDALAVLNQRRDDMGLIPRWTDDTSEAGCRVRQVGPWR
jgi:hypothetical protein